MNFVNSVNPVSKAERSIKMKAVWGIMGGMGGLASAEFVRTIYEYNASEIEQDSPVLILYSDPTFPDRTQAFLDNAQESISALLADRLEKLYQLGSTRIVLCCVTLHYTLPTLPAPLRNGIISLVDVALDGVLKAQRRQLLLCSSGTRAARIFQEHEHWPRAADYIVWPDEEDQRLVHRMLYQYKLTDESQPLVPHLDYFQDKYRVDSFVAGCSELHMVKKHLLRQPEQKYEFIDPLMEIACNLDTYGSAETPSAI
jgi:aspartate racemase